MIAVLADIGDRRVVWTLRNHGETIFYTRAYHGSGLPARERSSARAVSGRRRGRKQAGNRISIAPPPGGAGDMREKLSQILGPVGPATMAEKGSSFSGEL